MGNGQAKESKLASIPHAAVNRLRASFAGPSTSMTGSGFKLEQGFQAHTEGVEKTTLTKQDFTDEIFVAIPDVGKRIYKFLSSMLPGDQPRKPVDKTAYSQGGAKLAALLSDAEQLRFYLHLFAKAKTVITVSEFVELLSLSEQASWLGAGIALRPTPESRQCFEKRIQSLFKTGNTVSMSEVDSWSHRMCPKMTGNLHGYVLACLMDTTSTWVGRAQEPAGLVKKCKDGQSLLNLSTMWLLTRVIPSKFFPSSPSSCVVILSHIANIVQHNAWHVIYDSNSHGLSLNRFQHHVMNYLGPTILILSFDQFIYAVAIDMPWTDSAQRWGGIDGMFFQIDPDYRLIQSGEGLVYSNLSDRSAPKGLHIGKDSRSTFLKVNYEMDLVNHYSVDYKLIAVEVWGCGGEEMLNQQIKQYQWDKKEVTKIQNRKLVPEDWKESPDKALLEFGGVATEHNERLDI